MSKLKEGDQCWFWSTRNPKDSSDISELWDHFDIRSIYLYSDVYLKYFDGDFGSYYKSKEESLQAMRDRLLEIEESF